MNIPQPLIEKLRSARSVAVLTGAGVSAESGIPTFRDSQNSLWAKYRPEELASPAAFQRDPRLVWEWYDWRLQLVNQASPNPAHAALAEMEARIPDFRLITQNVDGLHQRAGSQNVVELHGSLRRARCTQEQCTFEHSSLIEDQLPTCSNCGALLRPDVVWFGETLPAAALAAAVEAAHSCEVFFSVGTSGMVEPAASLPYEALRRGAVVVEVNPLPTPLAVYTPYSFAAPAGVFLPELVRAVWPD